MSTANNRTVPPLVYPVVERIKKEFKDVEIILNGGVRDFESVDYLLNGFYDRYDKSASEERRATKA